MRSGQPRDSETLVAKRDRTTIALAVSRTVQTIVVLVLLAQAGAKLGFGTQPLPQVDPLAMHSVDGTLAADVDPAASWLPLMATTLIGLALCTPVVDRPSRPYRLGLLLGASYWLVVTAIYALAMSDMRSGGFTPGDRGCMYDGCWPAGIQQALLVVPVVPTVVAMVVMASVFAKRHWLLRALVPPAMFAASTTVQALVWEPLVVPLLESTP